MTVLFQNEDAENKATFTPTASEKRVTVPFARRSIFERELLPVWRNRLLTEIVPDDLRVHCAKIVERGAPATAIHVRDILKQIYGFTILHGEEVAIPPMTSPHVQSPSRKDFHYRHLSISIAGNLRIGVQQLRTLT